MNLHANAAAALLNRGCERLLDRVDRALLIPQDGERHTQEAAIFGPVDLLDFGQERIRHRCDDLRASRFL
jgi:hypothetical protein